MFRQIIITKSMVTKIVLIKDLVRFWVIRWYLLLMTEIWMTHTINGKSIALVKMSYLYKLERNSRTTKIYFIQMQTLFYHNLYFKCLWAKYFFLEVIFECIDFVIQKINNVVKWLFMKEEKFNFNLFLSNWKFLLEVNVFYNLF